MVQPGGRFRVSRKFWMSTLGGALGVTAAVFVSALLLSRVGPSHSDPSFWPLLGQFALVGGGGLVVLVGAVFCVEVFGPAAHSDEAQARQRVRQAEDELASALRGQWRLVIPVDAGSGQLATPSEDHAQPDRDQISRDDASPETGTRIDLNQIAKMVRTRQAQRESDESDERVFVFRDGTLDRNSVVDRVSAAAAETFYGPRNPKTGADDRSNDRLTLAALWDVTHGRMDLYHQIVTGQARNSFRAAQAAMGVGFVMLVIFAVVAVQAKTTTGAITTASLGAVGAAFAAYIGKTFIRSQESAASHLRAYFDQPLELSRYLAAERLLADAELTGEQRAAIVSSLVQSIATAGHENSKPRETKPGQPRAGQAADGLNQGTSDTLG